MLVMDKLPFRSVQRKEFVILWGAHFQGKFGLLLFYEPSFKVWFNAFAESISGAPGRVIVIDMHVWPTTSTLANMLLERCPRIFVEDCDYLQYACYKEECSLFLLVATFGRQSLSVGLLINYACASIFARHFSCVSYARSP